MRKKIIKSLIMIIIAIFTLSLINSKQINAENLSSLTDYSGKTIIFNSTITAVNFDAPEYRLNGSFSYNGNEFTQLYYRPDMTELALNINIKDSFGMLSIAFNELPGKMIEINSIINLELSGDYMDYEEVDIAGYEAQQFLSFLNTNSTIYTPEPSKFTVRFLDWDGTVLQIEELEEGATPVYKGSTPTRPSTAEYTYTFNSWDKAISAVSSACDYTAVYNAIKNKYTIRFLNHDGTVLQSEVLEYGATPTYKGTTPTKASDTMYTYTFNSWNKTIASVSTSCDYTATFTSTYINYTADLIFHAGDYQYITSNSGNVKEVLLSKSSHRDLVLNQTMLNNLFSKKSCTIHHEMSGYDFIGWSLAEDGEVIDSETIDLSSNTTINLYAVFAKQKVTARFFNHDGTLIKSMTVNYGSINFYDGDTPTKTSDANGFYRFIGWNPSINSSITADTDYTAEFEYIKYKYTIRFLNWDGTVLESNEVDYNTLPVYSGTTPTRPSTAEFTYAFSTWDKELVNATADLDYTATFSSVKNTYTIRFLNWDNTVLQSEVLEYGATPTYKGATPIRPATAQYTYTFSAWNKNIVKVTSACDYTAVFVGSVNSYTVRFLNWDGTVLQSETLEYGTTPSFKGETPTRPATAEYTYTFNAWNKEVIYVSGNADYTAVFTAVKNKYTIRFLNWDGTVLQSEVLEYGLTPSYSSTPTRTATAEFSYTFKSWDKTITTVTGNCDYTAVFTSIKNKYTIRFLNYDGYLLQSETLEYGVIPSYKGATPTKANTNKFSYSFSGWNKEIVAVTENCDYTAVFTETDILYTILFLNYDGTVLETLKLKYGVIPTYSGDSPIKPATAEFTYVFKSWDKEIATVTGNCDYTATFTEIKNKYTISFNLNGAPGTAPSSQVLEYGATITQVDNPTWSGRVFMGWLTGKSKIENELTDVPDSSLSNQVVTSSVTYYAIWRLVDHTVKFLTNYGDNKVILELTVAHGSNVGNAPANPTRTGYTFLGWSEFSSGKDTSGNLRYYPKNDIITSDVYKDTIYYAIWKSNSTLTIEIDYVNEDKIYFLNKSNMTFRDGIDEIATVTVNDNGVVVPGNITNWEHVVLKGDQSDDDYRAEELNKIKCTWTPNDNIMYSVQTFILEFDVVTDDETIINYSFILKKNSSNLELLKTVTITYTWGVKFTQQLVTEAINANLTSNYIIVSCSKTFDGTLNLDETIEVVLTYKTEFYFDLNGGHPNATSLENGEIIDYVVLISDYYINYNNDGTITYEPVYSLNPIRNDYIFKGWYKILDDGTHEKVIPSKIVVGEAVRYISLTAEWEYVSTVKKNDAFETIVKGNYTDDNSTASKNDSWISLLDKLSVGGKVEILLEKNYLTYIFKEKNSKVIEKIRFSNDLTFLNGKTIEDCYYMVVVDDNGSKDLLLQYYLGNNEYVLYYPLTGVYFTKDYITLYSRDIALIKTDLYNEYYLYFNSDIPADKFTMLKFDYTYYLKWSGLLLGYTSEVKSGKHTILDDGCDLMYIVSKCNYNSNELINSLLAFSQNNFEEGNYKVNNNSYSYRMKFCRQENKVDVGKNILSWILPKKFTFPYGNPSWLTFENNEELVFNSVDPIECSYILNGVEHLNVKVYDKVNVGTDEPGGGTITDLTPSVNPFDFVSFFKALVKLFKNFSLIALIKLLKTYYGCTLIIFGISFFGIKFYPIFKDIIMMILKVVLFIPSLIFNLIFRRKR